APRMGNAPDPTAVTAMAVGGVGDWIKTVPSTPTLSPTQGVAAKANILCAAAPPSPAKPPLVMLTAQISRQIRPAMPHQPRTLVHTGSWIASAPAAAAGGAATATEPLVAGDCLEGSPFPELLSGSLPGAASSMQPTLRGFPGKCGGPVKTDLAL